MSADPSRRPSDARVRIAGDINAPVWVECWFCLGDGWHYPEQGLKNRKIRCGVCEGRGARQTLAILTSPNSRIVGAPRGWAATANEGQLK
jgi:hypothetical protein